MSSESCQLSEIADVQGGYAFKSADFGDVGIAVIKIANIQPPQVSLAGVDRVSPDKVKGLERFDLKDGDILMAMTGATVGKVGRFRRTESAYLNQRVARVAAKKGRQFDNFIYAILSLPGFDKLIEGSSAGSAQANISAAGIGSVKIPRLSETDQLLIGNLARLLDDRIALLRETNATLEDIAQAMFKSWFVDFDPVHAKQQARAPEGMSEATPARSTPVGTPGVPPDPSAAAALFPDSFEESELGLVPKGWRVGTLADMAVYQNGYAFKTQDWQDTGYPVVKIGNVKPGIIDIAGTSCVSSDTVIGLERFLLKRGDLLVGMTGYVGETGLMPDINPPAYLNQRVGRISTSRGIVDLGFVYCIVRNAAYKTYAEAKSHGSAQANVSGSELMSYPTVLPSSDVLESFNQTTHRLIDKILANHAQAQTLATLRDTLLPRLISGQLRLDNDNQEVVSSL